MSPSDSDLFPPLRNRTHRLCLSRGECFSSTHSMASSSKSFNPNKHLKLIVLLRHSISSYQPKGTGNNDVSSKKGNSSTCNRNVGAFMATITADFFLMVLPILLCFTVLSEWTYLLLVLLLLALISTKCCAWGHKITHHHEFITRSHSPLPVEKVSNSVRNIISVYWVATMVVTCLWILAVDFRIFPRKYAETEAYGTSLVHVGEYGVHWNFFFTLAAVSILTSIINIPPQYCGVLGIFILIGHWGMYIIGVQLGHYLFFGNHASGTIRGKQQSTNRLWILALLFWLLTIIVDKHVERVSCRMVLAIFAFSDFVGGSFTSVLEDAINRNLLGSFLLVN